MIISFAPVPQNSLGGLAYNLTLGCRKHHKVDNLSGRGVGDIDEEPSITK